MQKIDKISILGLGYIGLPTAVAFANAGCQVFGVDINPNIIRQLNQAQSHFNEPDLAHALTQAVSSGRFFASSEVSAADAFIIAVPTPLTDDFQPDLRAVKAAVEAIAPHLAKGNLVVLESTSPVGTTEQIANWLTELRPDLSVAEDLFIAYCPERVLPSNIMQELYQNDRIIGGLTPAATEQAVALYQLFAKGECLKTTARVAEMCKLTENSFRDVNIAFANELSMLCDVLQINVWELIKLANRHPRVNILQPAAGVGGHCIAVDPHFIVAQQPTLAKLIKTAREINDFKPKWVLEKIKTTLADCLLTKQCEPSNITIACFGLTFKADVDDLRESPALQIATELADWQLGELLLVEPHIQTLPDALANKAKLVDLNTALQQADILVLLVDHAEFKPVSPKQTWLVDTRGVWRS